MLFHGPPLWTVQEAMIDVTSELCKVHNAVNNHYGHGLDVGGLALTHTGLVLLGKALTFLASSNSSLATE